MTTLPLPRAADPRSLRPFGDVIEASDAVRHFTINGGNTERYHDLATSTRARAAG
jgi:ureidoglycolate lyase